MVSLGDLSSGAQITLGVCVGVLSTSVQSLGLTLQRKSHLLEDDRPPHVKKRPPHRRRRWQIGILLFIVSNILGSSVQITTLPLVILSPLQASGLVFNSICATLILSEPFTRHSLIGTILVCVGAALIAAFGAMEEPAHSLDELLDLLVGRGFLVWMGGTVVMVLGILGFTKANSVLRPRLRHTTKNRMARGVAYGCVSGILSAHCLLLAKSAVELLIRTAADRVNQFNRWQSWMILLGLVTLALTQLYYLHRGLKLCSTSVLYPLVFCVYNIIAILDGLLYYRQASRLTILHGCLIALGTAILLSGVLALSWRLNQEPTKPPATATSALSPGLGFVDTDTSPSDTDTDTEPSETGSDQPPLSPSSRHFLTRRRALTEVAEIWGELQDAGGLPLDEEEAASDVDVDIDEESSLLRRPTPRYTNTVGKRGIYILPRRSSGRAPKKRMLQGAIGGWWKLKWWKDKDRDGSGGGDDGDNLVP